METRAQRERFLFLSSVRDMIRAAADEEERYVSWTKLAVPHVSELIKYTHTFNYMSIELC